MAKKNAKQALDKLIKEVKEKEKSIKESSKLKVIETESYRKAPEGYIRLSQLGLQTFNTKIIESQWQTDSKVDLAQKAYNTFVDQETAAKLKEVDNRLLELSRQNNKSNFRLFVFKPQIQEDTGFNIEQYTNLNRTQQLWQKYNATVEKDQRNERTVQKNMRLPLGQYRSIEQALANNNIQTFDVLQKRVAFDLGSGKSLNQIIDALAKNQREKIEKAKLDHEAKLREKGVLPIFSKLDISEAQYQSQAQLENALEVANRLLNGGRSNLVHDEGVRIKNDYIDRLVQLFGTDKQLAKEYIKQGKVKEVYLNGEIFKHKDPFDKNITQKVILNENLAKLVQHLKDMSGTKFLQAYDSQVGIGAYDIGYTLKKIVDNVKVKNNDFNDSNQGYDFDELDADNEEVAKAINEFIIQIDRHFVKFSV